MCLLLKHQNMCKILCTKVLNCEALAFSCKDDPEST